MASYHLQVKHHLGPADRAEISDLLVAASRADGRRPLSEDMWQALERGDGDGFVAIVAHEVEDAQLVGYAQLGLERDHFVLALSVHPAHRGWAEDLGRSLLGAAVAEVARSGGRIRYWVVAPSPAQDADARAHGFVRERDLLELRVALPLPPAARAGVPALELRAFRPGHDEQAWLEVNNRAFAGHPEQGDWDLSTLARRQAEPWFEPAGFLCLFDDGRLIGSCWTKRHTDVDPPLGEIYVIAVDPEFHHRGLGRALTVAGLDWLAASAMPVGMLYVDAANHPAVALYEKLGFTANHRDRAYAIDVPAVGASDR